MQTAAMQRYHNFDSEAILAMHHQAAQGAADMKRLAQNTKEAFLYSQIKEIVENYYDLGDLIEAYQNLGGYINTTFGN